MFDVASPLSAAVSAFIDGAVADAAEQIDRSAAFSSELYGAGVEAGLTRLMVDADDRLDLRRMRAVHESTEALAAHSPAVALQFAGTRLIAYLLTRYAPQHAQGRWLGGLLDGSLFGSFAITEPHTGTDVRAITSVARRDDGGDWVLDGEKCWIGFAPMADVAIVLAKVDSAERDADTVALIVDTAKAGVIREEGEELSGFRGMPNGVLRFRSVRIDAADRLDVEGFAGMMDGLNYARIEAASYACGLLRGALVASTERAATREAFGSPLGELPSIQMKIGRMLAAYHSARELTLRAYESFARGGGGDQDVISIAKMTASDLARHHTDEAMQIFAASGIRAHSSVERMHRDAKVTQIFDGTSEIHETMLGRRVVRAHRRYGRLGSPYLPHIAQEREVIEK